MTSRSRSRGRWPQDFVGKQAGLALGGWEFDPDYTTPASDLESIKAQICDLAAGLLP
jgi:hypothetical protein